LKKALLIFAVGTFMFSCGKSACDCKKESEELTSQSFREKFSGDYNESQDKLKDLDEDCEDYSKEDYKDCD
jgi:hypothetical protein